MTENLSKTPSSSANLLPPSGALMPPTMDKSTLTVTSESGEQLVAALNQAGVGARRIAAKAAEKTPEITNKVKALVSRAAAMVAEKGPELRDKALEAGARIGEIWADETKRRNFFIAYGRKLVVGVVIVVIVIAGGWIFAVHQASSIAKGKIDALLIRNDLTKTVAYRDVAASPFGSVTIADITVRVSPTAVVKVGALQISDIDMKGDAWRSANIVAKSIEIPLLVLAREGPDRTMSQVIGLGYTKLTGDVGFDERFDDRSGKLSIESSGHFRDAGDWNLKIKLAGITPEAVSSLAAVSQTATRQGLLAALGAGLQARQSLGLLALEQASATIDDSGWFKRSAEITGSDMPEQAAIQQHQEKVFDETELVRAGMAPSEAKASREAVENWLAKGGTLRFETNLNQPLALFTGASFGGSSALAFASPEDFLVATKAEISN